MIRKDGDVFYYGDCTVFSVVIVNVGAEIETPNFNLISCGQAS